MESNTNNEGENKMTNEVRAMIQGWVAADGGDTEKTVRWAANNMGAIGGRKDFWRAQVQEAIKEA